VVLGVLVRVKQISSAFALGAIALLVVGCETEHHARVDDGAELAEGSAVMVSGVRVGSVGDVRVIEGAIDVAFLIDDDHEGTSREVSSALAVGGSNEPTLILYPGEGRPLTEERALPQCELADQALRDLAEQFGDTIGGLLRSLGSGFFGGASGGSGSGGSGSGGPSFPMPSLPPLPRRSPGGPTHPPPSAPPPNVPPPNVPPPPVLPAPLGAEPTCDFLSARIDSVERATAVPLHLPQGGYRVWFEFRNTSGQTMQISSVSHATFSDRARRELNPASLPGGSNIWFMPFDVPANGTARRAVVFEASESPQLDEIEVRGNSQSGGPRSACSLRSTGLSTP